jgi:glucosamine-6-phosphate deaminase
MTATSGSFDRSFDALRVRAFATEQEMAAAAAGDAASVVHDAIAARGVANVMFATGNSQLAFIAALVASDGVDWSRLVAFHMDEYVGVGPDQPVSFAGYIRDRIVDVVHPKAAHYVDGVAPDADAECRRYATLLRENPLDLCCMGIGENGHLAFNDPPVADFDDPLDVKVVELDGACRRQQVGEGHFPTVADVPTHAITVTIPALLRARRVLVIAPEARKAEPVRAALTGPISTACPASILRRQAHATLYLDGDSAALVG